MSSLAGQFAGILLASVPGENREACLADIQALESRGLRVIACAAGEPITAEKTETYSLSLIGNDRPGIVHDITTLLANQKVSVQDFETMVEGASMGGGEIFKANAVLLVPENVDIDDLSTELEDLANDLMVDINFK